MCGMGQIKPDRVEANEKHLLTTLEPPPKTSETSQKPIKDPQEQSPQLNDQIRHGWESRESKHRTPLRKNQKKTRRKLWSLLWNMEDIKKTESVTLKIGEEFSRFRQKAKVFVMYLVKQTKPNVHIPTTAEVGYTLYSRRSRLANNPEKGRAGKRKIKRCSPSVWRRWLKIIKCMAQDGNTFGL